MVAHGPSGDLDSRLRVLQKLSRSCFNCGTLFGIFVCTDCSGKHMNAGHRVKSVSMGKFTPDEVKSLEAGGNEKASKLYLAMWNCDRDTPRPTNRDPRNIEAWITAVFCNRKYYSDTAQVMVETDNISSIPVKDVSSLFGDSSPKLKLQMKSAGDNPFGSTPAPAAATASSAHSSNDNPFGGAAVKVRAPVHDNPFGAQAAVAGNTSVTATAAAAAAASRQPAAPEPWAPRAVPSGGRTSIPGISAPPQPSQPLPTISAAPSGRTFASGAAAVTAAFDGWNAFEDAPAASTTPPSFAAPLSAPHQSVHPPTTYAQPGLSVPSASQFMSAYPASTLAAPYQPAQPPTHAQPGLAVPSASQSMSAYPAPHQPAQMPAYAQPALSFPPASQAASTSAANAAAARTLPSSSTAGWSDFDDPFRSVPTTKAPAAAAAVVAPPPTASYVAAPAAFKAPGPEEIMKARQPVAAAAVKAPSAAEVARPSAAASAAIAAAVRAPTARDMQAGAGGTAPAAAAAPASAVVTASISRGMQAGAGGTAPPAAAPASAAVASSPAVAAVATPSASWAAAGDGWSDFEDAASNVASSAVAPNANPVTTAAFPASFPTAGTMANLPVASPSTAASSAAVHARLAPAGPAQGVISPRNELPSDWFSEPAAAPAVVNGRPAGVPSLPQWQMGSVSGAASVFPSQQQYQQQHQQQQYQQQQQQHAYAGPATSQHGIHAAWPVVSGLAGSSPFSTPSAAMAPQYMGMPHASSTMGSAALGGTWQGGFAAVGPKQAVPPAQPAAHKTNNPFA